MVCEAVRLWLARSASYGACGLGISDICGQQLCSPSLRGFLPQYRWSGQIPVGEVSSMKHLSNLICRSAVYSPQSAILSP